MQLPPHLIAWNASFQALANCYLREVDSGQWYPSDEWQARTGVTLSAAERYVVELVLEPSGKVLAIGVGFRSLVGRHTLTCAYSRPAHSPDWRRTDLLSTQLLLVDGVYAPTPDNPQRLELMGRLIESNQVMTAYLQHWQTQRRRAGGQVPILNSFVMSERSVILGHWLHPTPKSRQGIHNWQHAHYAPEFAGQFQLHFFAVTRQLVEQYSLLDAAAEEIGRRLARFGSASARQQRVLAAIGDEYCLIPIHPLQAQWLLHQDYVQRLLANDQLIDCGRLGPDFTPTSSVRTLYCDTFELMIKVSMPVKITNSIRLNLKSELGDSVWISKLLRKCDVARRFPRLHPIEDPAYITLALDDREETGFEVIYRNNPFRQVDGDEAASSVQSIAALVQDPLPGQDFSQLAKLVRTIAERERVTGGEAGRRWFDAYFHCSIEPTLALYDEFGVSLEAHQQNVVLEIGTGGYPTRAYYRDIQGLALAEGARAQLVAMVPELERQAKVFEDNDIVRNGFGYYVFFNQLFSVINRLALDNFADEQELVLIVRKKLIAMRQKMDRFGASFIDAMLSQAALPCKANLLTRVADMDELQAENELAVYTMIANPLHLATNP